jgi:predicted DNA-binding transcriptional regulator AlpA
MRHDTTPARTVGLPRMLNSTQVAQALGVNPSTLSRWRAQGVGPRVYWLGPASPRYREDHVLEWLERNAS